MTEELREAVLEAIKSIGDDALDRIERKKMQARQPFLHAGHRGSTGMEIKTNEAAVEELRAIANDMVAKIREYDPANAASYHFHIGNELQYLGNMITEDRRAKMNRDLSNDGHIQSLSTKLNKAVWKTIDDVVRDLQFQRLQHTGGNTYVAIGDVNAPINLAVGQGNVAQQTNIANHYAGLKDALAAFRTAAANPLVSEDLRLAVVDQVEVIEAELAKPQPNEGKVKRLCRWFADKAIGPAFGAAVGQLIAWLAS